MPEPLPSGIEQLLALAAADAGFADLLLGDRAAALQQVGVELSPTEQLLLRSIDEARLQALIDGVRRAAEGVDASRRALVGGAAAALLGALSGCGERPALRDVVADFRREVQAGGGGITGIRPGTGVGFGHRPWRTPYVVLRLVKIEVTEGLSREIVRRILRRHRSEVRFCFQRNVDLDKCKEPVEATLAFAIRATGQVAWARLVSCSLDNKKLQRCMVDALRRWQFPKPRDGKTVQVSWSLRFTVVHPKKKKQKKK